MEMNSKVSIITPVYNASGLISETIESVINQSYKDWELILVDDCSTDNSATIIKKYEELDNRIRYYCLECNSGAAVARNKGLELSTGRYIAYLDVDDLWYVEKLEKQVNYVNENNAQFICCDYEKINEDGSKLNKIVKMPKSITYNQLLSNTIIQTVGVFIDLQKVNKKLLVMPNVRRGQDSATWLQMLKNGVKFNGQNEVLAAYRRVNNSLSSNKLNALKRTWYLYRGVEKLSIFKSIRCIFGWAYHASIKRIYLKNKGE